MFPVKHEELNPFRADRSASTYNGVLAVLLRLTAGVPLNCTAGRLFTLTLGVPLMLALTVGVLTNSVKILFPAPGSVAEPGKRLYHQGHEGKPRRDARVRENGEPPRTDNQELRTAGV